MVKGLGSFANVKVSYVTIPIIKVAELVLGRLSSLPMDGLNKYISSNYRDTVCVGSVEQETIIPESLLSCCIPYLKLDLLT